MPYGTGVKLVLLAALLWSLNGLLIRQIDQAGTWAVLFWRSAGMIPVLLAVIAWRSGGVVAPLRRVGWSGLIGGLGLVLAFGGAIFAFQATTVANAVFLFSASPFLAAILGWLILRESVRPATWAAIALAGVGMFVMVREGLAAGAMAGNVAALVSALGFASFTIALRWGRLADMLPAVVLGGLLSMLAAAAVLAVQGQALWVPARDIAISLAMGAVILATGMALYTAGSRVIPAAELTLLSMVEVLLAPVWVFLALGETASRGTFAGGAVLMAAVALNALSGARQMRRGPVLGVGR
ncbi:MAG: DMT family transporter [Pseudotabrizicola sp.]|uniref:DMT family transporter n=1 Tax=Pseudotabrizicola sp. TaxID=2939647 RepID=UPI0027280EF4|nr:DMT family transporter [Pseudotabrizicola sp.]MDO8882847.1 DMT family transporter [Pseudotabrizicola sp.]MDP2081691.1 DMT family transporter [Pseudotabrizicola sp.]MDZ7574041.1 DMT family transporter [Pseudotabrizicola sp.]